MRRSPARMPSQSACRQVSSASAGFYGRTQKRGSHRWRRGSSENLQSGRPYYPTRRADRNNQESAPRPCPGRYRRWRKARRPSIKVASGAQGGTGVTWGGATPVLSEKPSETQTQALPAPPAGFKAVGSPTIEPKAQNRQKRVRNSTLPSREGSKGRRNSPCLILQRNWTRLVPKKP